MGAELFVLRGLKRNMRGPPFFGREDERADRTSYLVETSGASAKRWGHLSKSVHSPLTRCTYSVDLEQQFAKSHRGAEALGAVPRPSCPDRVWKVRKPARGSSGMAKRAQRMLELAKENWATAGLVVRQGDRHA